MIQDRQEIKISFEVMQSIHRLLVSLLGIVEESMALPEHKRRLVSKSEYKRKKRLNHE